MQEWVNLKDLIASLSGLDRASLHVLASVPLYAALALLVRRPLTSLRPLLLLMLIAAANEVASGYADGILERWEIPGSLRDLVLVLALPAFLFVALRIRPLLPRPRVTSVNRAIALVAPPGVRREVIIDADYEEVR